MKIPKMEYPQITHISAKRLSITVDSQTSFLGVYRSDEGRAKIESADLEVRVLR
jgi:hypothetical protein